MVKQTRQIVFCLGQSLAGYLFGYEQSVISGLLSLPSYIRTFGSPSPDGSYNLPSSRQSILIASFSIGCLAGALASGPISAKKGGKKTILGALSIFLVGLVIQLTSGLGEGKDAFIQFVIARILTGLGVGSFTPLVVSYQGEMSPPEYRAVITGSFQLVLVVGIFLCNVINYLMHRFITGTAAWRIPISIELPITVLLLIGFSLSPESPNYLYRIGRLEDCRKALAQFRGSTPESPDVQEAFEDVQRAVRAEAEKAGRGVDDGEEVGSGWKELFSLKDRIFLRLSIGILLQVFLQLTGVNFFFSFGVQFFATSGISDAYLTQIILSGVNFVITPIGIYLAYRLGRRTLLLGGSTVMFLSLLIVGAIGTALPNSDIAGKILVTFSCVFIAGFAASWGCVVWTVSSEIFPTRLAGRCITLAIAASWLTNVVISFVAPVLTNADGAGLGPKICFLWGGSTLIGAVYVFMFVVESKDLSISEIDALFLSRTPAWRSKGFIHTHRLTDDGVLPLGALDIVVPSFQEEDIRAKPSYTIGDSDLKK